MDCPTATSRSCWLSVQNLRRGHYELSADVPAHDRLGIAFTELARCL
jgi:hypothetical protein